MSRPPFASELRARIRANISPPDSPSANAEEWERSRDDFARPIWDRYAARVEADRLAEVEHELTMLRTDLEETRASEQAREKEFYGYNGAVKLCEWFLEEHGAAVTGMDLFRAYRADGSPVEGFRFEYVPMPNFLEIRFVPTDDLGLIDARAGRVRLRGKEKVQSELVSLKRRKTRLAKELETLQRIAGEQKARADIMEAVLEEFRKLGKVLPWDESAVQEAPAAHASEPGPSAPILRRRMELINAHGKKASAQARRDFWGFHDLVCSKPTIAASWESLAGAFRALATHPSYPERRHAEHEVRKRAEAIEELFRRNGWLQACDEVLGDRCEAVASLIRRVQEIGTGYEKP